MNDCSSAAQVPDLRIHLLDQWAPGKMFVNVVSQSLKQGKPSLWGHPEAIAGFDRRTLANAELWWIRDEMVQVIAADMPSNPDDVTPEDIDLPSLFGMAVFEKSWVGSSSEDNGGELQVDAIVWGPVILPGNEHGIGISSYQFLNMDKGMTADQMNRILGPQFFEIMEKASAEQYEQNKWLLHGGAWCWLGRSDWKLGDKINEFSHLTDEELTEERQRSMEEDRRFLTSFSILVQQKLIAEQETVLAPRPVRRRAERAGSKGSSDVKIVRLRVSQRPHTGSTAKESNVEWGHRWIQRGHKGYRWCGPGRTQRKLVYIRPGVKGPADKPLKIKETVNAFVR